MSNRYTLTKIKRHATKTIKIQLTTTITQKNTYIKKHAKAVKALNSIYVFRLVDLKTFTITSLLLVDIFRFYFLFLLLSVASFDRNKSLSIHSKPFFVFFTTKPFPKHGMASISFFIHKCFPSVRNL